MPKSLRLLALFAVCLCAMTLAGGLGDSLSLEGQLASSRGVESLLSRQLPSGGWDCQAVPTALSVLALEAAGYQLSDPPLPQPIFWLARQFAMTEDWALRAIIARALWLSGEESLRSQVRDWLRSCLADDWRGQAAKLDASGGQFLLESVWLGGAEAGWSSEDAKELADVLDGRDSASLCYLYRLLTRPDGGDIAWSRATAAGLQNTISATADTEKIYWLARVCWAAELRHLEVPVAWRSQLASKLLELQTGDGSWPSFKSAEENTLATAHALLAMAYILR